jgi:hypothetical protein
MKRLLNISFIIVLFACEKSVDPEFDDPGYIISLANADSLHVELTSYDRVTITHRSGSSVKSRDFRGVGIGFVDSSGYNQLDSSASTYDNSTDAFSFQFNFPLVLDATKTETIVRVRYYHRESGFTDIDTTILQYKYPYSNAEIFVDNSIFTYPNQHFQALVRMGNKLYFHPTGGYGLFEYDLVTEAKKELYQYGGGDHLAADSIFVFCDVGHNSIKRFNLVTNTKDLDFQILLGNIRGLETYQGLLYALDGSKYPRRLYRFTYDGSLVDSTDFPWFAYHITISDGVLYAGTASTTIKRINLATMSELPSVAAPTSNLEGISIYNGDLYFCDWYKRIVGSVPLQDLQ